MMMGIDMPRFFSICMDIAGGFHDHGGIPLAG